MIKSILKPNIRYVISSYGTDNFDRRGNRPFMLEVASFDTLGDGDCQHTPAWCPQYSEATDVMLSLAVAIVANPTDEQFRPLCLYSAEVPDDAITFALGVKYREGKDQYYSVSTRKVTTADKRHDKRFERVEPRHDGTAKSALDILFCRSRDWFWSLDLAMRIREAEYQATGGFADREKLFPDVTALTADWSNAYAAFSNALKAIRFLDWSKRGADCAIHNSTPRPEITETVAA